VADAAAGDAVVGARGGGGRGGETLESGTPPWGGQGTDSRRAWPPVAFRRQQRRHRRRAPSSRSPRLRRRRCDGRLQRGGVGRRWRGRGGRLWRERRTRKALAGRPPPVRQDGGGRAAPRGRGLVGARVVLPPTRGDEVGRRPGRSRRQPCRRGRRQCGGQAAGAADGCAVGSGRRGRGDGAPGAQGDAIGGRPCGVHLLFNHEPLLGRDAPRARRQRTRRLEQLGDGCRAAAVVGLKKMTWLSSLQRRWRQRALGRMELVFFCVGEGPRRGRCR